VIDAVVPADADAVLALLEIEAWARQCSCRSRAMLAAAAVILFELTSLMRRE